MKDYTIYIVENDEFKQYRISNFQKDRIIIGKAHADIVINAVSVSHKHLKLKIENNSLYFADIGSTNGSFTLSNMHFVPLEKNKYYKKGTEDLILRLSNEVILIISDSSVYTKVPVYNSISIGRNEGCNIFLNHLGVSRLHAEIKYMGSDTVLSVIGLNGAFVNGKKCSGITQIKNFDIIQILSYKLIYFNNSIYYKKLATGAGLEAKNLVKRVKDKYNKTKTILNNVSLKIESNDFVAIVGGSGAGKTTLMDAISGFDDKLTSGKVYFNGIDLIENISALKDTIGYVPQQDIIFENLTLRRMLRYTIKLKASSDLTKTEMERRIDDVLETVELTAHQNTYIRKLSGGQKKRASIAVELLGDPDLLFLDEPTSGLDPGTEAHLMKSLRNLAKNHSKTIIMVTHTTQSLDLCDKVIFMGAGGKICFCGSVDEAKMFFDTDSLVEIYEKINDEADLWSEQYRNCFRFSDNGISAPNKPQKKKHKKVNGLKQLGVLTMRYAELIKNDTQRLLLLFLQPILMGILMYFVATEQVFDYYDDAKSIFFVMSCAAIWLGVFNSIQEICKERVILRREYMGNLNLTVYILSKYIIQIVIGFIQAIIMLTVFTLIVGLPDIESIIFSNIYLDILLVLFMTILASSALGLLISSFVKSNDRAMAIAPFALIIQLLFSGILFELSGVTQFLSYFTVSRWSMEGFGNILDLNNMKYVLQETFSNIPHKPEAMFLHTSEHYWMSIIMLFLMILLLSVISVISLQNVSKNQR